MFIPARKNALFYVMKQTYNKKLFCFVILGSFRSPKHSILCYLRTSTIPVLWDKSLKTQYQVSFVLVEAIQVLC